MSEDGAAMFKGKGDLTQGPVGAHLVRLSLPMTVGILAFVSFQLASTWYVSMLGTLPLAAITLTFPVAMGLFNLFIGMAIAMSSVVSRQIGAKVPQGEIQRMVSHGLLIAFAIGLLMTVVCLVFMDPMLRAMGADGQTLPLARAYMEIWFWGNLFIAVPVAGNAALRAAGDAVTPAAVYCAAALLNIVFDPLLIFGIGPFPRLGIQGAAVASVFANFCSMSAVLYILRRRDLLSRGGLHLDKFANSARRLLFIALPAGITGMIMPAMNGFIIFLLSSSGAAAIAAYGVATRVESFAFVILMGLATGMGPVLGQNWGARDYGRVREALRKALAFTALWSLGTAAILGFFSHGIAALFSASPDVIHAAALYFLIVPLSHVGGNLVNGWSSAFNALGLPLHGLAVILVRNFVLTVPLAWYAGLHYGPAGVFSALALVNIVSGAIAHAWGVSATRRREDTPLTARV